MKGNREATKQIVNMSNRSLPWLPSLLYWRMIQGTKPSSWFWHPQSERHCYVRASEQMLVRVGQTDRSTNTAVTPRLTQKKKTYRNKNPKINL